MNKRIKKKKMKMELTHIELGNLLFGNSRGKYQVNREWSKDFYDFLEECCFDSGCYYEGNKEYINKMGGFENEVFIVNPYYWGLNEEKAKQPNFIYKPLGFNISWYKYPFRDSYMNKYISKEKFKEILKECKKSIKE